MKVLITDEISQEGLQPLLDDPRIELEIRLGLTPEELHRIVGRFDAMITRSGTTVDAALLEHGRRLKIVARAGVGIDNVDVDAASSRGIIVVNAPYGNVNSAAEHSMALMLSLCRNVPVASASLKSGEWKRAPFTGRELKDKTLGIIGLGKVGGRVALRAKAFEMTVLACDPYISPKRAEDLGVKLVGLEEIVRYADIVSLHCPRNAETIDMINARHFDAMKDGVIIVNCARGEIVNEAAMLAALQSGKAAGAAFDVFSEEPPRSELVRQLIAHPLMVVTPHLGANTFEAQKNVAVDVSKEIVRYLDGQPLESAVNIPKFDAELMQVMQPFLSLIQQMGEFIVQLAPANPSKVTFTYNGKLARYDCSPLTVCGLAALLNRATEQEVNMVNSQLIAEQMGICVETVSSTEAESFSNLITITLATPAGRRTVAGTIFEGMPKIVKMRDFNTDFQPEEHMLVISYADKLGLIGKIGTILGEAGINIGSMNLGRRAKAGEAMVVLSVDTPVPAEVIDRLAASVDAAFIRAIHMENASCID
ncbi:MULTISPECIES: phosphoglycerate dehydrogenase [Syntrophotalea]|jgi:D-3-phosphoglycerate dehydrogenase|uniref:D-3-phosphoglycerate dehydrogenase n=1 Tax=Syntrophotalea acetylenica TaxID=29542 RepID=A0A1L3GFZ6_SYNAC|nr:phosphoglycerate dehydrogenase [Syntrophotalea acetylenica]APG24800.1 phosphoglycerate dehydrogenase [Syntrophotalea acetylenica]APG42857.1 phosphoglycerate dehydrogenase [Syntrophotalea acetylenica]MDY0263476.1 phosphoglycerate dehydrogenase [Syntrophotalea acetylenica]